MNGWKPLWILTAVLAGCSGGEETTSWKRTGTEPIRIVCTTGMVADLVRHVGGGQVRVTQLMGADVDPHRYQASPGDVSRLNNAQMIFYSGLHLEANLVSTLHSLGRRKPVFAVTDEIERWHRSRLIRAGKDMYDPHVWFDVSLWKTSLKLIADRLCDFDPQNAAIYVRNARAYEKKLDELHAFCQRRLKEIPPDRRVLVTAHDAFSYFGRAYGISVKAIQGISTVSEASIHDIEALVDFIVSRKIKAVFVETSVPSDNIQQLIDGCRAKGHPLKRGGELFSDAMGKPGTPQATYEGMIRHNIRTIVNALK